MSNKGLIIYVEDDQDDQLFFKEAIKELDIPRKVLFFPNTDKALEFLGSTQDSVFAIFCDINLPGKNGLDFKRKIDSNKELRMKSIPFLFFTTSTSRKDVNQAFDELTIQGFFQKPHHFQELKDELQIIFNYWQICKHPNNN